MLSCLSEHTGVSGIAGVAGVNGVRGVRGVSGGAGAGVGPGRAEMAKLEFDSEFATS